MIVKLYRRISTSYMTGRKGGSSDSRATHARKKIITKNYKLNGVSLAETSSTTYLGVKLSADMKWNTHVKNTAAKGNQMLGVFRRNLKKLPKKPKGPSIQINSEAEA